MTKESEILDIYPYRAQRNDRVLVVSNLRLTSSEQQSAIKSAALSTFLQELDTWRELDMLVFAGNLFDLSSTSDIDLERTIEDHAELFKRLYNQNTKYGTTLLLLPGTLDSQFASRPELQNLLRSYAPITISRALRLSLGQGDYSKDVIVTSDLVPSDAIDARVQFENASLLRQLTKRIGTEYRLLSGAEKLEDPSDISAFVVSRLVYQRGVRYLPLVIAPIILALALKIPFVLTLPLLSHLQAHHVQINNQLVTVGANTVIDALIISGLYLIFAKRMFRSLERATTAVLSRNNKSTHEDTSTLVDLGYLGAIESSGLSPSLLNVSDELFIASPGAVTSTLRRFHMRFGLPDTFLEVPVCSWIELTAGSNVHVKLLRTPVESEIKWLWKVLLKPTHKMLTATEVLANFPNGKDYPQVGSETLKESFRARRVAYLSLMIIGFLELLSAFTPPLRARIHILLELFPSMITGYANSITVILGVGTLALANGVRRGSRRAWVLTLVSVLAGVVSNLIKGGDIEESLLLVLADVYLLANRRAFQAAPNQEPGRIIRASTLLAIVSLAGTLAIEGFYLLAKRHLLPLRTAVFATLERMVGISSIHLDPDLSRIVTPALAIAGVTTLGVIAFTVFNPIVSTIAHEIFDPSARNDPFQIVKLYGIGTLDYFALRDDKTHFVSKSTLIAYAIFSSTCVISPDPVGPKGVREIVLEEFIKEMKGRGLSIAVLGASEEWIETYQKLGLHPYYIGDEAIVQVGKMSLEGKANKSLRQAVNRMKKYGYTVDVLKATDIGEQDRNAIAKVLSESRKGRVERGFSMTLGRIFDERDKDLLLSICRSQDNEIVGFCQWVPTNFQSGYSLDLMRREIGDHPNGMMDLLIVETLSQLVETPVQYLSLNFAALRATLAGERGDGISQKVERWALGKLSDSMQIESLWRFNSKFNPTWTARYLVYDNLEDLPNVAFAVAKAESLWDIPILGRLLTH